MPNRIKIYRPKETAAELKNVELNLAKKGYKFIAGTDEAGRGPLAGPVVAAAVIIPDGIVIPNLNDSKKLTKKQREELFEEIAASGAICSVGVVDNDTIDRINILRASLLAMQKAILSLESKPDFVLVDGSFTVPNVTIPQMALIGGDGYCSCISAASIVAKVTRDRIMDKYQEIYPSYSFANHRGYPTKRHLDELESFGPTSIHRKSFKPVEKILNKSLFD